MLVGKYDAKVVDNYIDNDPTLIIVFTNEHYDYGEGLGNLGWGKANWLPYTHGDRGQIENGMMQGCDNTFLLAHEISHSYGSKVEKLDAWNSIVGIKTLMEMNMPTLMSSNILKAYADEVSTVECDSYYQEAYHSLRYLNRTFGKDRVMKFMNANDNKTIQLK